MEILQIERSIREIVWNYLRTAPLARKRPGVRTIWEKITLPPHPWTMPKNATNWEWNDMSRWNEPSTSQWWLPKLRKLPGCAETVGTGTNLPWILQISKKQNGRKNAPPKTQTTIRIVVATASPHAHRQHRECNQPVAKNNTVEPTDPPTTATQTKQTRTPIPTQTIRRNQNQRCPNIRHGGWKRARDHGWRNGGTNWQKCNVQQTIDRGRGVEQTNLRKTKQYNTGNAGHKPCEHQRFHNSLFDLKRHPNTTEQQRHGHRDGMFKKQNENCKSKRITDDCKNAKTKLVENNDAKHGRAWIKVRCTQTNVLRPGRHSHKPTENTHR